MPETATSTMNGAHLTADRTEFRVWAPNAERPNLPRPGAAPEPGVLLRFEDGRSEPMQRAGHGNFTATTRARAGDRYFYQVGGNRPVPDPVSRLLPEGVHGPTEIVDPGSFRWTDHDWRGIDIRDYIIYELHVGTFSPQGTFEGVRGRFEYLKQLGITAVELMPVAAFPGRRNWGYDGVSPYAVQASYGGPDALKRLVDAAHATGLAVIQDVVYNHFGPEGNYLRLFGPYFTNRHQTPWGEAINYDGPGSEGVRRYVVENALYWVREYHMDALRLDAIQTIKDDSRYHIVEEIRDRVQELARDLDRRVCVIAETDENDARLVRPKPGGFGLDGVWSDDFHHALHTVLTGEDKGYYQDFGEKEQIALALNEGFVYQGEHFKFWGRARGTRPEGVPAEAHVICIQNHDQVGNRAKGERLTHLVPVGARYLAAALLLLAPQTPLLFMGQEYDESAPFQFFSDFGDPALRKAVSDGRRREFEDFPWDEVPDPQDPQTFERSRLHWNQATDMEPMLRWYRDLIALRKRLVTTGERTCRAEVRAGDLIMQVPADDPRVIVIAEFPDGLKNIQPPDGWREELVHYADGYGVRVLTAAGGYR